MSLLFLFVLCVVGFQCCAWCRPAHLGPLSTCCVVWEWWCCFNCCCVVDLNIWVLSQLLCCILFNLSWFFVVFLFLLLIFLLFTKLYKSSLSWLCCMMYVVVGFVYVMMLLFQVLLLLCFRLTYLSPRPVGCVVKWHHSHTPHRPASDSHCK